ncbi:Phosphoinositide-3-kinase-interacting protein 1 Kringle domain-containing protein HGFL Precursor [Channa argus]|uniref:Phosphoinositide-3-kinase-interacting protein 1 Kringle domain-containing protein HGFL n=1 Tax=Channa argus TaxID=215402 RepID=A0A6G1PZN9_CHAAH|nr:Phosphoinositide-3-kinase-interacting protein 1 Kringle domain-containing protein HGFL Precursor [Channa argus]
MLSFEDLIISLQDCVIREDQAPENGSPRLRVFFDKVSEFSRTSVKRSKERCLDEALQLLRQISEAQLRSLEEGCLLLLVRLLLSMQLQVVNTSTACRKVDQMLCFEDLQKACMFLEDSVIGHEVWRESFLLWLNRVSELFPVILQQESLRDGPLCYFAVKVCLQVFQLLSREVAPLVWDKENKGPVTVQTILQALMDIILGQCLNRDTRLLAGTTVAMLINTGSESRAGGAAAWSLLQVSRLAPWHLSVGALEVECHPKGQDGVDRLAVSRGLLTGCRPNILLSSHVDATEACLLLTGLFPLVYALCEEKCDCHYFAVEVLSLWLKKVKECLADIWKMTGVRLLPDNSSLQQQLIHIIWTNAESPVERVSEFIRTAFCLLLDLYEMDCKQFCDTKKTLYCTLLERIIMLPWETKAKYHHLCALLPYLGTDQVLDQYAEIPNHLLKCLSTNHLSPCGSELYKCLIQQQRQELCSGSQMSASCTELDLANHWAKLWRPVLHEALMSDVALLQHNSSTHLLPCTFQVFPSALEPLLASLDPFAPGHLPAWACIMSSYRATTGGSPWALQGGLTLETLQLALGSADDKNLNCESSPFRQHFQAGVKKFLVRIRDCCLAQVRGQTGKKKGDATHSVKAQNVLEQGIGFVDWLYQLPYSYLAPGHSYQRKKTVLLLLSAVLETCTDTWNPDKKKGQPPDDIAAVLLTRTKQLLCSPRVQEAQMGALMMKVLFQKLRDQPKDYGVNHNITVGSESNPKASCMVRVLVKELEEHYLTAKADMMCSARTKPIHGVLSALQRCLLEAAISVYDTLDNILITEVLGLLENISLLLLSVLYGDQKACATKKDAPPSFCDMGNAINSLIAQASGGGQGEGEECVLLSEEHSLILTCCWVSLKVCAVHTLQALVRGSGLGVAVLQFAPAVVILSLTLLSSPCWAMRNAALQLYSSLCSRMLGQRPNNEEGGPAQRGMSPSAFFFHYPGLQSFLLGELREAAQDLQGPPNEAKLYLQPSLYPVLTLNLSDFLPTLLQLAANPVYSVRVMASKALVAMTPPSQYMNILIKLTAQLPSPKECCCHNRLHGQLLQIKAMLERALYTDSAPLADMHEVLKRVSGSLWLVTEAQHCPLVRAVYLSVAESLRSFCSKGYLSKLSDTLMQDLQRPQQGLQSNLREALLSHSVEYRKNYLAALIAVMAKDDYTSPHHLSQSVPLEEPFLPECLDLLLWNLEEQQGGPEFLSQALYAASLLVSRRSSSLYQQDEANVFAEPSVMSAQILPYLLQMAEKYSESTALAQTLRTWVEQTAAQLLDSLTVCKEIVPDCVRSSGVGYRGEQDNSSTGLVCINWTNTTRDYDVKLHPDSQTGVGDHNYCRNPDTSEGPWCYIAGPDGTVQRQFCAIDKCKEQASTMRAVTKSPNPIGTTASTESFQLAKSGVSQEEVAAVQPVMGISQRVHTGPKKKKDLGVLGYVLGILMMTIIIMLGVGITLGYFYKRAQDLKKQHEQRVYEREMQRITLPLSAFSNPTCELVDENTIVITAEHETTPVQDGVEGWDPLMGQQAGTPGA